MKRNKKQEDEEQTYGCDYDAIVQGELQHYNTSWGPIGFKKANHPLAIMVCLPLVSSDQ